MLKHLYIMIAKIKVDTNKISTYKEGNMISFYLPEFDDLDNPLHI